MKTKTTIVEIYHEDIVNLLSTALYGSDFFGIDYDSNEYRKLPEPNENDTIEDMCAKLLLNGKHVTIRDIYAEDEEDFHGGLHHEWDSEYEEMEYTVSLADIKRGLQKCLDGTFKKNDGCGDEVGYIKMCMTNYMDSESFDFDLPQAESIMQIIVFGQLIYG